jgi:hypothetical protein
MAQCWTDSSAPVGKEGGGGGYGVRHSCFVRSTSVGGPAYCVQLVALLAAFSWWPCLLPSKYSKGCLGFSLCWLLHDSFLE